MNEVMALDEQYEIELQFYNILTDVEKHLDNLMLVGGWLPFVYMRFLWNDMQVLPVTTTDVDFGILNTPIQSIPDTIYKVLSNRNYKERHIEFGKEVPVVLYKNGVIRLDFIAEPDLDVKVSNELLGREIYLHRLKKFDFLLSHGIKIEVINKQDIKRYKLNCPVPSAFLYHKGATSRDRDEEHKKAKDLYYMYFILRYAPEPDKIFEEISEYSKDSRYTEDVMRLKDLFHEKNSPGCVMVEKENGPDPYIYELREDIYTRFNEFFKIIS
ncbi:MAG: hypothetical protein JW969_08595 [Spirochaetales bacterium]|nr:hypothetical protein [Spirochaetales bacterium]